MTRVSLESGQALQFIQENKDEHPDLSVIFPEPLKKDSVYKIDFEYSGGDAIVSEGAGNYTLVARDDWYPAMRRDTSRGVIGRISPIGMIHPQPLIYMAHLRPGRA